MNPGRTGRRPHRSSDAAPGADPPTRSPGRILYFDLDGTLVHAGFGSVKPRLADGGFERAVRAAGFERLMCVANAVAIVQLLEEAGGSRTGCR